MNDLVIVYRLENFWLNDAYEFVLGELITIRLANDQDKVRMKDFPRKSLPLGDDFFVMEQHMSNPQANSVQWSVWSALFSLRLMKGGSVGYNTYCNVRNPKGFIITKWPIGPTGTLYIMEASEILTAQTIYADLLKIKRDSAYVDILRRFNASYDGPFYNRLSNLVSALEALYVGDKKVRNKKVLVKNRLLGFLSSSIECPEIVSTTINVAYEARHSIQHESRILDSNLMKEVCTQIRIPIINVFELMDHVEEYARVSLRKWASLLAKDEQLTTKKIRESISQYPEPNN